MEDIWVIRHIGNLARVGENLHKGKKLFKVIFPSKDFGRFKLSMPNSSKVNLAVEIFRTSYGDKLFNVLASTEEYVLFGERE